MVAVVVFVAVLITDTLEFVEFATSTRVPAGFSVTPRGCVPTGTAVVTVFVPRSMNEKAL
jgi:hypothetical protein